MDKKPSRPIQILLYSGLALGLVLVFRLVFGGLTGMGAKTILEKERFDSANRAEPSLLELCRGAKTSLEKERRAANGCVTVADKLNAADAGRQAAGQTSGQTSAQPAVFENDKTETMNPEFMQRAIELAAQNIRAGGGPFAAVIVKDGRIVAETGNTVTRSLDPTAHAEVNAIREACRRLQTFELRGCEIYSSCEPCPMCMAAIYWARLDVLYFAATRHDAAQAGFDDDFLYRELPLEYHKRSLPCFNVMAEEGKLPFADWAQYDEKIPY